MNQEARDALTRARTALLIDQPFFGTLAMRLELVENSKIKTLDVDGKTMRYNPTFVLQQPSDIMRSAVAHEVMHCVLEHCGANGRGITLNPKKWNYAADYAVNQILKDSGFKLGESWLFDPQFKGMSAEQIYALIPDPPDDGSGGGGNGGPQDEVLPGNPDPAAAAADAADWQVATQQAANVAQQAGKLSEPLERFLERLRENKVDWKTELRRFLTQVAQADFSWLKPNRKMLAHGFFLPGVHSIDSMGPVFVYSDESGSVCDDILRAFGAEVDALKEDLRPEKIVLAHFATQIHAVEEFGPDDPFEMVRKCDGGTDFRRLFPLADKMDIKPACAIVLTDLDGPFPQHPPDFPVLWVSVNKKVAPFGETLHIQL